MEYFLELRDRKELSQDWKKLFLQIYHCKLKVGDSIKIVFQNQGLLISTDSAFADTARK
jgi:hypothetical protein